MTITPKIGLIIPTKNAGESWSACLGAIAEQTLQPDYKLVIDSSSTDDTRQLARTAGFEVKKIPANEFDHGGTRQLAATMLHKADILIYLTQDAVLTNQNSINKLVECLSKPNVASAYGRQRPNHNASAIAVHHREFNYPDVSSEVHSDRIQYLGIKSFFCSNSFAAYKRSALMEVGGFTERLIMGEDMIAVKALILSGYTHVYCAQSLVWHSHNFTLNEEIGRYFDMGVLHVSVSDLKQYLGATKKAGRGFVQSELNYTWKIGWSLFLQSILRNFLRASAYYMGRHYKLLPARLSKYLSSSQTYWSKVQ